MILEFEKKKCQKFEAHDLENLKNEVQSHTSERSQKNKNKNNGKTRITLGSLFKQKGN